LTRLIVVEDGIRTEPQLFDAEPSLDVLKVLYPAARIILQDLKRDQWIVVLGDEPKFGSWPR
jgi:hypothetical protein